MATVSRIKSLDGQTTYDINAITVNGHTVNKDVPSDAVFTDHTYDPATATPSMDGTGAVGTSDKYAREDHVHPSDTSRVPTSRTVNGKALSSNITLSASDVSAIATSAKGAANGVAELDANGLVPTSQLPSYVDDVLEYTNKASFPSTGETGKIYVDKATNLTYRWSGSAYVEISPSLALGTTSSTAFRGDYGNTAYLHATDSSRLTAAQPSGFYKIGVTSEGHVASVDVVAKSDITDLGIPESDTNTTYTFADGTNGFTVTPSDGSAQTVNVTPSMTILSYGSSTWADFLAAYQANSIVYCRASSNSNPATGSQTRMAFMAYVNNATTPTEVEFQYYRSVSTHSDSQQGDQVYVYKLTNKGVWTVIVRSTFTKVTSGTGLSSTWSSGTWTAKANLVSDTALTNSATAATEVADRIYPVAVDANSKLAVNVPWNDTTYTFAGGTNKFTVTPSGGTAQDVTITPSITNNVTGSGTSGSIAKFNGANTVTDGPALGSSTTTYLRNDGEWATPPDTTYSLVGAQNTTGLVKNGSSVSDATGLTPCPIVGGIPYYQGASASIFVTASVPTASWTASGGVYSQTVTATGVTAEMNGNIMIDIYHDSSVTTADWQNQTEAYGTFGSTGWAETGADSITLHCLEQPANDFSISIKSI